MSTSINTQEAFPSDLWINGQIEETCVVNIGRSKGIFMLVTLYKILFGYYDVDPNSM